MTRLKPAKTLLSLALMSMLSGCVTSALENLSDSLTVAILDQNDAALVREGLPAYLLMTDGLIEQNPEDSGLLMSGAKLYAFYASDLVGDNARASLLTQKARNYAKRALCIAQPENCEIDTLAYDEFNEALKRFNRNQIDELYSYGLTWAAWLKANSQDWNAIADRPKIESMFERLLELDETHDRGRLHYYLGILRTQLPPAQGGNPEIGKQHFERAIELSKGQDLAVKVALARYYARMIYDRDLHDRLLQQVIQADVEVSGLTLSNTIARQEAQLLLNESDSYFQE